MSVRKVRVLFVAGLTPVADGSAGGAVTAAITLLNQGLGDDIEFVQMSTTMASNPPPALARRAAVAAGRLARFCPLAPRCDAILIFTFYRVGFVEEGAVCFLAAA